MTRSQETRKLRTSCKNFNVNTDQPLTQQIADSADCCVNLLYFGNSSSHTVPVVGTAVLSAHV